MAHLLRIDASARIEESHSRALGDYFETAWEAANPITRRFLSKTPKNEIVRRDLAARPISHIANSTIAGFYTPPDGFTPDLYAATAMSDELIAELQAADTLVITTPLYNFSVPSSLKAWIDQIMRIGHTFSFDGENFGGLLQVKDVVIICAYGANGYLDANAMKSANFLQPYLEFLFGFMGAESIRFISAEGMTGDAAHVDATLTQARADIDKLFAA
ncbi:NAD(P)H-dependent oxidoreductase [Ponticaulis sp.]|uniref:FMN-dependent NADH-azoreductase n=1 Tax=Ponticaulis sp. TaxID=2020902 RepID=UPI00261B8193|nr:NAD(P)H-dependent oxidoreductase [Ponticaulis sp.]MDF1680010.1 NAD(P)H-dependent oxidoreductase [Ponticaulis sp.]